MQFLRTLLWVAVAVIVAIVATHNWRDVTLDLWGDLQLDVKLPALLILTFLLGFLPPFAILRGRLWQARRRLEAHERNQAIAPFPTAQSSFTATEPDAP